MQLRLAVSLSALALTNLSLLAQPAGMAGLPGNGITNRPAYKTRVAHVAGPGVLPADFGYITLGTNEFGFVMPEGFHLEAGDPQKVMLVGSDINCVITFRLLGTELAAKSEPDLAHYRQLALSRYPGGKIVDELSLVAAGRRGPAFDLRWDAAGFSPRRERVLFIPREADVLEFSLSSSLAEFEAGRRALTSFLLTFRTPRPDGRLIMPVMSDRL